MNFKTIQDLPDSKKRVIFWVVMIIIAATLLFFYAKSAQEMIRSANEDGKLDAGVDLAGLQEELNQFKFPEIPEVESTGTEDINEEAR